MPRYAAPFWKNNTDSVRQLMELTASASQRMRIDFFSVGCVSTPADAFFKYVVRRVTGSATGTFSTVTPVDPNDGAARSAGKHIITADHSTFNTSPVEVFRTPCHHRASYVFAAADGQELVGSSASSNGISLGLADVSASLFEGVVIFKE